MKVSLLALVGALFALAVLIPAGENPGAGTGAYDPVTGEHVFTHDWNPIKVLAVVLGILAGYLLLLSPLLAYRWPIGFLIPRRWRRRVHAWFGAALLVLALAHGILFPLVGFYEGWLSGILAVALLGSHGATGAFKTRLVRGRGASRWTFLHLTTAWAALLMTLFHSFGVGMLAHWAGSQ